MASYDGSDLVTSGEETKKEHFDQLLNNMIALAAIPRCHKLGGEYFQRFNTIPFEDVTDNYFAVVDGTEMAGFSVRLNIMCLVLTGTAYVRLYNESIGAIVAGSTISFTNTSADRKQSLKLFLPSGANRYKLQIRTSTEAVDAGIWNACIMIGG